MPAAVCVVCGGPVKRGATKYCGAACYRIIQRSTPLADRFWAKVQKTDTCWLWTSTINPKTGYGMLGGRREIRNGRSVTIPKYAHRVAYELANGPIPDGQWVLHHCDVPRCVNPDHLFLGTQKTNMEDAASKGRLHVSRPSRQKVTPAQLAEIDALLAQGGRGTQVGIAKRFGVTESWVSQYVHHRRRHFDRPSSRPPAPSQLIQQANPAAANPLSRRDRPLRAADRAVRIGRGGVALARFGLTAPPLE